MKITVSLVYASPDGPFLTDITIEDRAVDKSDPRRPGDITVTGASEADAAELLRMAADLIAAAS